MSGLRSALALTLLLSALPAHADVVPDAPEDDLRRLKAQCLARKGHACLELGVRYLNGRGVEKDSKRALSYYHEGCLHGSGEACGYAGTMVLDAGNAKKSRRLREKACTLSHAASCNDLGSAWAEGKNGAEKVDQGKARSYYERACKLKDGLGCFNLGNAHRLGEGVARDPKRALELFQTSCDLRTAKGCTELAILHFEGKVTPKNVALAISLFEKACKLGSPVACKNLEILRKQRGR